MEEKLNSKVSEEAKAYYNKMINAGLKPGAQLEMFEGPMITAADPYLGEESAEMIIASLQEELAELREEVQDLEDEREMLEEMISSYMDLGTPEEIDEALDHAEGIIVRTEECYGTFEQMDYVYSEFARLQEEKNTMLIIGRGNTE